jgi:DNA invertase Pin-like site-specific DNA recombinase
MQLARCRKVNTIIVSKLDRLARSLRHLLGLLDEFNSLGVTFVSVGDQIDMSTPSGRFMTHILGAFGEFERAMIRERTLRGLEHARRKGKRLGRPRIRNDAAILALRAQGLSYTAIQNRLGISRGAIFRATRAVSKSPSCQALKNSVKSKGDL